MNLSLSLVTLVLCLATWQVKACSVAWTHPQNIYCRSDYVLEVLVGERRNVYLQDDGSFELVADDPYDEVYDYWLTRDGRRKREVDSQLLELSGEEPSLLLQQYVSQNNITADEVQIEDAEMDATVTHEDETSQESLNILPDIISVSGVPHTPRFRWRSLTTQYSITIRKVLKGNVTKGESYLYTATSGAMCGVHLKENTPYLIMGYKYQNTLRIGLSGYNLDLTILNDAELFQVINNAGKYFKQGCQDCYVNTCYSNCPEKIPLINQCIWRNPFSLFDTRASQLACVHTEEGICDWYNAMEPTMVPGDLDKDLSH